MEKEKRHTLLMALLVLCIGAGSALIYIRLYRPMLEYILNAAAQLKAMEAKRAKMKAGGGSAPALSRSERRQWEEVREKLYAAFPAAETLPEEITFRDATNFFYGEGASLQEKVPALFGEIARTVFAAGGDRLHLVNLSRPERELQIPSPAENLPALNMKRTQLMITFGGSFRQAAAFLEGIQKLPRYTRVTDLSLKGEKHRLRAAVTLNTYHCPPGGLSNVPE